MRVISGEAKGHTLKAPKGMTTRPMSDKIKGAVYSMLSNILADLDRDWGRILDLYAGTGSIGIEALSRGAEWADFVEINAGVCRIISENLEHTKLTTKARVNHRAVHAFLNSPPPSPGATQIRRMAGGLHRRKGGIERDKTSPITSLQAEAQIEMEAASEAGNELRLEPEVDNNTIHNEQQYDIIFLDPPYADPRINDTLAHISRSGLIKPGGLVIIGHSPRVTLQASYGAESDPTTGGKPGQLKLLRHRRHGDSAFTIFIAGDPTDYGLEGLSDDIRAAPDQDFEKTEEIEQSAEPEPQE